MPQSQQSLPFAPPKSSPPARQPPVVARPRRDELWAAIVLPWLALEALGVPAASEQALVVIDDKTARAPVLALTTGARQLGVKPGMTVAAACAHVAHLQIRQRDAKREAAVLEQLAAWSQRFTSMVSVEPPQTLLLNIGASLKLFGGIDILQARIQDELAALGCTATLALAPTPRAAAWLAQAGHAVTVRDHAQIPATLGALSVAALDLPQRQLRRFDHLGVKTLRQAFRLPRDGLAKRFGTNLLRDWDQALGQAPDPRQRWQATTRFAAQREVPDTCDNLQLLAPIIDDLLAELLVQLQRHGAGVDAFALQFRHEAQAPTRVVLRLLAASRDAARLRRLVNTRLERLELSAAVTAIRLTSPALRPLMPETPTLWSQPTRTSQPDTLLETLRARLGRQAVVGLATAADPRPEKAWRRVAPDGLTASAPTTPHKPTAPRPFWLLPTPQPLAMRAGKPLHAGKPMHLHGLPERIESGWWAGTDLGRDYYQAEADDGTRLWVYREHGGARGWFLHGYFA